MTKKRAYFDSVKDEDYIEQSITIRSMSDGKTRKSIIAIVGIDTTIDKTFHVYEVYHNRDRVYKGTVFSQATRAYAAIDRKGRESVYESVR